MTDKPTLILVKSLFLKEPATYNDFITKRGKMLPRHVKRRLEEIVKNVNEREISESEKVQIFESMAENLTRDERSELNRVCESFIVEDYFDGNQTERNVILLTVARRTKSQELANLLIGRTEREFEEEYKGKLRDAGYYNQEYLLKQNMNNLIQFQYRDDAVKDFDEMMHSLTKFFILTLLEVYMMMINEEDLHKKEFYTKLDELPFLNAIKTQVDTNYDTYYKNDPLIIMYYEMLEMIQSKEISHFEKAFEMYKQFLNKKLAPHFIPTIYTYLCNFCIYQTRVSNSEAERKKYFNRKIDLDKGRFLNEVDLSNKTHQLIFQSEKNLKEFKGKISSKAKMNIENAIARLKEVQKGSNAQEINSAIDTLNAAWSEASSQINIQATQGQTQGQSGGQGFESQAEQPSSSEQCEGKKIEPPVSWKELPVSWPSFPLQIFIKVIESAVYKPDLEWANLFFDHFYSDVSDNDKQFARVYCKSLISLEEYSCMKEQLKELSIEEESEAIKSLMKESNSKLEAVKTLMNESKLKQFYTYVSKAMRLRFRILKIQIDFEIWFKEQHKDDSLVSEVDLIITNTESIEKSMIRDKELSEWEYKEKIRILYLLRRLIKRALDKDRTMIKTLECDLEKGDYFPQKKWIKRKLDCI